MRRNFTDASSDASGNSAAETLLTGCVSSFLDDLLRAPLEPAPLSLEATIDEFACPLSSRIAAPRALTADDVTFDISQPWCHPYRLVRVAICFPAEYESLRSADLSAAIDCFIGNMRLTATLDIPSSAAACSAHTPVQLKTVVRIDRDGPRCGHCVMIDIPVPAGITLRPGAAIALTVSIAVSSITLTHPCHWSNLLRNLQS